MNPWSENKMLRESLAVSRDTIADLEHKLASANSLIARMNDRADKLLAKVYELRANLPARVHPECFDRWHDADGEDPCVDCLVLLGVRT